MGLYGAIEHRYCEPVAEELAANGTFAAFFLRRIGYAAWVGHCRVLRDEQSRLRPGARYWWKNVFCSESRCQCPRLRGREVDILVVVEHVDGRRLGLHIECKHPNDRFHAGQAQGYRERLGCWTQPGRGPRTIPAHREAVAILLCARDHRHEADDVACFDGFVFFDEVAAVIQGYPAEAA